VTTGCIEFIDVAFICCPKIDEYTPPELAPDDPYPGYYQLPSSNCTAYDSSYQQFYNKWKADYDRQVRALEKKEKGFRSVRRGNR
jgi:proline-rich protein PRCC